MKIMVVFDVDGTVKTWQFANYLAEMLELPDAENLSETGFNILGIDDVQISESP